MKTAEEIALIDAKIALLKEQIRKIDEREKMRKDMLEELRVMLKLEAATSFEITRILYLRTLLNIEPPPFPFTF